MMDRRDDDEIDPRIAMLDDSRLRGIATLWLGGHSVPVIASLLGLTTATVHRKLKQIRQVWEEERGDDDDPAGMPVLV
jgi:hypothetical protein